MNKSGGEEVRLYMNNLETELPIFDEISKMGSKE